MLHRMLIEPQNRVIFFLRHNAASSRNDLVRFPGALFEDFSFQLAEGFLTVFSEDIWDRLSGLAADHSIRVDEPEAEALGCVFADCRLSGPHESD